MTTKQGSNQMSMNGGFDKTINNNYRSVFDFDISHPDIFDSHTNIIQPHHLYGILWSTFIIK